MQHKSTSDKIREGMNETPQTQAGQGFKASGKPQPKKKSEPAKESRKSDSQLAIHNQFEEIAGCISKQSEYRLQTLTHAVVSNVKQHTEEHLDVLEMAESGELEGIFLIQGLQERRQKRLEAGEPPQEYNFNTDGFDKRGYGVDLDIAITKVALEPFWKQPKAALPEA